MDTTNRHERSAAAAQAVTDPLAIFAMTSSQSDGPGAAAFSATDLVGWAIRSAPRSDRPLTPDRARDLLAAALGVPVETLSGLADRHVDVAVARLHNLVDQCRTLAAEVAIDELTGALRRGTGMLALQREIDRARRQPDRGTVVAFIDADGLKSVNDSLGHAAGDTFLCEVVAALTERLRSYDVIVRYGGDEFFCVLSNVDLDVAERLMNDIQTSIRARTNGLSVSVGVTAVRASDDAESVVARADQRLYASRRSTSGAQSARSPRSNAAS